MRGLSLIILLLSICHSQVTTIELKKDPSLLVNEVIDRYDQIVEASHDLAGRMEKIKEMAADFVKLALPLGTLVADSLHIVNQQESEKYKAMKGLNDHVNYQLKRLVELHNVSFSWDEDYDEFLRLILVQLDVLAFKVEIFTDPSEHKDESSIKDLLLYCNGDHGVLNMVKFIRRGVQEGCELNNTLVYVKVEELFLRLEQQFSVTYWNEHETIMRMRIFEIIHSNPTDRVLPELEQVEANLDAFDTFTSAIEAIHRSIMHLRKKSWPRCWTDSIFNQNRYHRQKISLYTSLLQAEMTRLLITSPICGIFTFPNDRTGLEKYLQEVGSNIENTVNFLTDYIPKKLNMSASGVEGLIVSQVINRFGDRKSIIPHKKYNELINRIKEALKNIGLERIEKQIIVVPSEKTDPQFNTFYICPSYWCTTVLNHRGIDAMITRFPKNQMVYAGAVEKQRDTVHSSVVDLLQRHYYISLIQLVDELESKKNVTLTEGSVRSAAIIRHKTICAVNCEYPTVLLDYRQESTGVSGSGMFQYTNFPDKAWLDDNTCYQFLFFL